MGAFWIFVGSVFAIWSEGVSRRWWHGTRCPGLSWQSPVRRLSNAIDILYMFSLTLKHSLKKHRNHWFFYLGISYWEYLVLGEGMTFTRYIEVPVHLTVTSGILHASLIACFGNLPKMLAWMPSCVWWSIVLARCKHICTVIWLI